MPNWNNCISDQYKIMPIQNYFMLDLYVIMLFLLPFMPFQAVQTDNISISQRKAAKIAGFIRLNSIVLLCLIKL